MDELLAHLGHDLRNPGTTLVSCVELLREVVVDPDGREAVEDAGLALEQLKTAWARLDVLAGRPPPDAREEVDLHGVLTTMAASHQADCVLPMDLRGLRGTAFVVDALLETTRKGKLELHDGRLRISDSKGPIPPEVRLEAFEVGRQNDMKAAGRYARFLGLVAAGLLARHLGCELRAGSEALYELDLSPKS